MTISPALRLSTAVLLSSLAAVPAYLTAILLIGDWDNSAALFPFLMFALMMTMAAVVVVGLPVHIVLMSLKQRSAPAYGVTGFAVPAVFVLIARPMGEATELALPAQLGLVGLFGACVALVFWMVAIAPR